MRLWTEEIEGMRAEARESVAKGMPALQELLEGGGSPPAGQQGRVTFQRKMMERTYAPVPEAIAREVGGVPCRVFVPEGPASAVYLHFHGGGMVVGAPEMSDIGNVDLCRRFGVAVVSVDYRLAPEHPYPAGPDDGVAVARWLLANAESEFGSGRLLIGGESAGGYMAAAVLLRIRDELGAVDRVAGANLVFGVYDWGRSPSQRGVRPMTGPDLLTPDAITFFTEAYMPDRTDDERRAISPAFADLRGLPPALMSVGGADHLFDDTLMLAVRSAAAGNEVDLFVAPDMPHGFMAFPCALTHEWASRTFAWFADILSRTSPPL
ncbi:MAG: alpha/beta hydrolase [Acidimicrobiales bacterium]